MKNGFYGDCDDWKFSKGEECRALLYAREFALHRKHGSHRQQKRAFYRYICKRGMYSPMTLGHLNNGQVYMYRRRYDNYGFGYPVFHAPHSEVRDLWYRRRNILFGMAMERHADLECQKINAVNDFREARRSVTKKAYRRYFQGIGQDDVPSEVLFLAHSLIRLKEVIKNKNRTRTETTLVRPN